VVIILADDLGYADVGFQGCRDIPTPHLDALAASGVRFSNGYSSHPFCSPMRAALLTSRYQHRFGYERNVAYDPQNPRIGLPQGERTIAERLKEVGYVTGAVGKWHLGAAHVCHPNQRGFDHFFGFLGGGHDYFVVDARRPMGEGYFTALDVNGKPSDFEGYLTDVLSDEAVEFIEAHTAEHFLLYLAYNAPHTPMQAPDEVLDRFGSISDPKRRTYAAMVSAMDDGIGRVLATLERLNLRERTLVFFLSDNGGPTHANASRNDPLRGVKGDVLEGGIRVPFVVSWPGHLPAQRTVEAPVVSIDIARTALAVAGAEPARQNQLDGVNLIPFITGLQAQVPHDALFWRKENGAAWAVRSGNEKLLQEREGAERHLYDLSSDIAEERDRAAEQPKRVARLQRLFDDWNSLNQPPRFPGFRPYHQLKNAFYKSLDTSLRPDEFPELQRE
jgi:arylsulfatase A-like enzyme